jgi:hypothetical protein
MSATGPKQTVARHCDYVELTLSSYRKGNFRMQKNMLAALKSPKIYKILTSAFVLIGVYYIWMTVAIFLDYKSSLDSTETVKMLGGDWPVSTIHAMVLGGWIMITGPYAAGVLAIQTGLLWCFRPKRSWLAIGLFVCCLSCSAIWHWIANQQ